MGVVTEKEKQKYLLPGLERSISKNRGIEFGSLLNQLGAELIRAPHGAVIRKILLEIAPDAKERLPKRKSSKTEDPEKSAGVKKKAIGKESKAAKGSKAVAKSKALPAAKGAGKSTGSTSKESRCGQEKSSPGESQENAGQENAGQENAGQENAGQENAGQEKSN